MNWDKFFSSYDFFEGFRSKETEMKAQEHMNPKYKKIYLTLGFWIRTLMVFVVFMGFTYFVLKQQNNLMAWGLVGGSFLMVGLCIVKQTMRKIIRRKFNI